MKLFSEGDAWADLGDGPLRVTTEGANVRITTREARLTMPPSAARQLAALLVKAADEAAERAS